MPKNFSTNEKHILSLFPIGTKFVFNEENYIVTLSGKPTCEKGEPKTDIYISARDSKNIIKEFKISFKQENADFLENKINAERAKQLFGDDWQKIIIDATSSIKDIFNSRKLIYKTNYNRTEKGSITLGWKFELLNKKSGELSGELKLTKNQVIDVYSGTNLTDDKKDAKINNMQIASSGIANYILFENTEISNPQQAIDKLTTIDEYVDMHPNIYFACKALNYRTYKQKYDGNRPLAVYIDWCTKNNKLDYSIKFNAPLITKGNDAFEHLSNSLSSLNIATTDDLDSSNVENDNIICE